MTQAFNLSQLANNVNTSGQLNLSAAVYNTLAIANGGTNNASLAVTAGGVLYTDGTKIVNVGVGTTGQYLKSNGSSAPTWDTLVINNGGSTQASPSANVTLTASSNKVQVFSPTASGLSVILPNATTLSAGGILYQIYNQGGYSMTVKDSGGNPIHILSPLSDVTLFLYDNSTANGKWATNNNVLNIQYGNTASESTIIPVVDFSGTPTLAGGGAIQNTNGTSIDVQQLTSTTYLVTYVGFSNTASVAGFGIYGCVATISGASVTFGTPTLIQNAGGTFYSWSVAVLNSTSALFFYNRQTTTPTNYAYQISISGTSVSAVTGNDVTDTITGGLSDTSTITKLNGSIGMTYYAGKVRPLQNNGGTVTPTWGTSASAGGMVNGYGYNLLVATNQSLLAYKDDVSDPTTGWYFRAVTWSGTNAPVLGAAFSAGNTYQGKQVYINRFLKGYSYSSTEAVFYAGDMQFIVNYSGTTISTVKTVAMKTPKTFSYSLNSNPNIGLSDTQLNNYSNIAMTDSTNGFISFGSPNYEGDNYICQTKYVPAQGFVVGQPLDLGWQSTIPANICAISSTQALVVGVKDNLLTGQVLTIA